MSTAQLSLFTASFLFYLLMTGLISPAVSAGQEILLQPEDLVYKGAFRLPAEGDGWVYGGGGLSYFPLGDPGGSTDGYPGSLFGIGNDQQCAISEISIPEPRVSERKRVEDLNTATTLQPFSRIFQQVFTAADDGLPQRADIAYLPPQDGQTMGKLYLTWGEHYQYEQVPSHAWSELDLAHPEVQGPWYLAGYENFATNDYLFAIPDIWAAKNTPGLRLVTGRFRDGSLGGSGPSLFAFGPWNDGNPPAKNARLSHVFPLLLYEKGYEPQSQGRVMKGYTNADEWTGGEWVTSGQKSAVLFSGTKGKGNFWYGFSNGVVWPDNPPYPAYPPPPNNDRGWWADSFDGVFLFYNPDDLARVAAGTMAPYEPQPYADMEIDGYLYHITGPLQKMHVGDIAFDRERGFLYLAEPFADGEQPIIHVFRISSSATGGPAGTAPTQISLPRTSVAGSLPLDIVPEQELTSDQSGTAELTQVPGFAAGIAVVGIAFALFQHRGRY